MLEPAAERKAVNRSNDRLLRTLEDVDGALADRGSWPALAELADVRAGDERAPCANQHHRLHGRILFALGEGGQDTFGHAGAQRVDGRIVDGDDANAVL